MNRSNRFLLHFVAGISFNMVGGRTKGFEGDPNWDLLSLSLGYKHGFGFQLRSANHLVTLKNIQARA